MDSIDFTDGTFKNPMTMSVSLIFFCHVVGKLKDRSSKLWKIMLIFTTALDKLMCKVIEYQPMCKYFV